MKIQIITLSNLLCLFLLLTVACTKSKEEDLAPSIATCDTNKTISYKNDVQPILNSNCGAQGGCHSNGSASGGVKLESWQGSNEVAASGLITKSIRHESGVSPMPKGKAKLDDCYISIIQRWIREGRSNN